MVFQAQKSWGLRVALCLFLEGAGAGSLLFGLLFTYLDMPLELAGAAALTGTLTIIIAALFLLADLGRGLDAPSMLIARRMALLPNWASWVLRGSVSLSITLAFGLGYSASLLLARYIPPIPVGIAAAIFSVIVILYAGFLLASSRSTPFWSSAILPVLFLFSGLSSGVAVVYLTSILILKGDELASSLAMLRLLGVLLIILQLVTLATYLENSSHGQDAVRESLRLLTRGALAPQFWGIVVIMGLIVPLVLLASPLATSAASSMLSALLLLLGGAYLRHLIIRAGVRVLAIPPGAYPVTVAGWTQSRR